MNNPGLVGYLDSDTDSEQEENGTAPTTNTGIFISTSSVGHVTQKQDTFERRVSNRELAEGPPPLKRRREENPSTGPASSVHNHVVVDSQEQGAQQVRPHPVGGALSLPSAILEMFKEEDQSEVSVTGKDHQGRVRSFPHVSGNWATHVYLPFEATTHIFACINNFLGCLRKLFKQNQFHVVPDVHVSLSRTVPIQHHCIEPLMESLRSKFRQRQGFVISFKQIAFYTNDDCTRSFVGLDVASGRDMICSLVRDVDECFSMYRLQQYYKNPSFHVSLYWCVGDILRDITDYARLELQDKWEDILDNDSHEAGVNQQDIVIEMKDVRCKTGNKIYSFPLIRS